MKTAISRSSSAPATAPLPSPPAVRGRLAALDLRQVDVAPGQRAEALALVLGHARQPELVDRIGQQQHLDALGAAGLELRARAQRLEALAADRVDRVLAGLHARDVVGEADPAVLGGAAEARELEQALALLVVLVEALLEHRAELVPEGRVVAVLGLGAALELVEQALDQVLADPGEHRAVLQRLARDVELQVLGIDDAAHEAQVARHQAFEVGGDEHPPDVELDAVLALRVVEVERLRRGHEQQRLVGHHALGLDVEAQPGVVEGVPDVVVELLVLLVADLGLGPRPERARGVDLLGRLPPAPRRRAWAAASPASRIGTAMWSE